MKKDLINVVKSHTGFYLIGGAVALKMGAITGSIFFLLAGYGALGYAIHKKWRDRK